MEQGQIRGGGRKYLKKLFCDGRQKWGGTTFMLSPEKKTRHK